MLFVISKKRLEVKWMNTQCEEELLKPSAGWWLLNVSVGGWGGDAVISAAMPLQPSPVWHPALSHPSWPQCRVLTTELPASLHHRFLPSWAWRGLDPLPWSIWEELFNQVKEKKNIYTDICIIIQIYKKKKMDYRDRGGSLMVKCRDYALWFFRGGMYRKPVNIVYFELENMEI